MTIPYFEHQKMVERARELRNYLVSRSDRNGFVLFEYLKGQDFDKEKLIANFIENVAINDVRRVLETLLPSVLVETNVSAIATAPVEPEEEEFVPMHVALAHLNRSISTLYSYVNQRKIRTKKNGRETHYAMADIQIIIQAIEVVKSK